MFRKQETPSNTIDVIEENRKSTKWRLNDRIMEVTGLAKVSSNPEFIQACDLIGTHRGKLESLQKNLTRWKSVIEELNLVQIAIVNDIMVLSQKSPILEMSESCAQIFRHCSQDLPAKLLPLYDQHVLKPVADWMSALEPFQVVINEINSCRLQYDHYFRKVEDLREAREKRRTKGKMETVEQNQKFERNKKKLEETKNTYNSLSGASILAIKHVSQECWIDFLPILLRSLQFQVQYFKEFNQIVDQFNQTNGKLIEIKKTKLDNDEHRSQPLNTRITSFFKGTNTLESTILDSISETQSISITNQTSTFETDQFGNDNDTYTKNENKESDSDDDQTNTVPVASFSRMRDFFRTPSGDKNGQAKSQRKEKGQEGLEKQDQQQQQTNEIETNTSSSYKNIMGITKVISGLTKNKTNDQVFDSNLDPINNQNSFDKNDNNSNNKSNPNDEMNFGENDQFEKTTNNSKGFQPPPLPPSQQKEKQKQVKLSMESQNDLPFDNHNRFSEMNSFTTNDNFFSNDPFSLKPTKTTNQTVTPIKIEQPQAQPQVKSRPVNPFDMFVSSPSSSPRAVSSQKFDAFGGPTQLSATPTGRIMSSQSSTEPPQLSSSYNTTSPQLFAAFDGPNQPSPKDTSSPRPFDPFESLSTGKSQNQVNSSSQQTPSSQKPIVYDPFDPFN